MLLGLVAAALLPIVYLPVSNPVAIRWRVTKGNVPMTPEVYARAELVGNTIPFVRELLLLVGILCLSSIWGPPTDQTGWNMNAWSRMLAVGIFVGLGWLTVYALIVMLVRPTKSQLRQHRFLSRSVLYWLCLNTGAAVVEEMWRGYCLTVLHESHAVGPIGALLVSSGAFGLAHSRSLWRIGTTFLFAIVMGLLFLWGRSQWTTVGAHLTVNIGTIFLVRWSYGVAKN
jgi:membrane protease YdiL (CAAX protease family)